MSRARSLTLTLVVVAVVALLGLGVVPATAGPATETFASFGSTSTGDLDGTAFTITGCTAATLTTSDLSGAAFAPAGSASQPTITCTTPWSSTVTFAQPVSGVDVYLVALPYGSCTDGLYTFTTDGPGTLAVASGLADSTVSGSTLTVPYGSPSSGVVHVSGSITSLTIGSGSGPVVPTAFTLGTVHVEPTTTTTSSTVPGPDVAGADASAGTGAAAVAPAFTC